MDNNSSTAQKETLYRWVKASERVPDVDENTIWVMPLMWTDLLPVGGFYSKKDDKFNISGTLVNKENIRWLEEFREEAAAPQNNFPGDVPLTCGYIDDLIDFITENIVDCEKRKDLLNKCEWLRDANRELRERAKKEAPAPQQGESAEDIYAKVLKESGYFGTVEEIKLRVCGSPMGRNAIKAMEEYKAKSAPQDHIPDISKKVLSAEELPDSFYSQVRASIEMITDKYIGESSMKLSFENALVQKFSSDDFIKFIQSYASQSSLPVNDQPC